MRSPDDAREGVLVAYEWVAPDGTVRKWEATSVEWPAPVRSERGLTVSLSIAAIPSLVEVRYFKSVDGAGVPTTEALSTFQCRPRQEECLRVGSDELELSIPTVPDATKVSVFGSWLLDHAAVSVGPPEATAAWAFSIG
jgi:hypothetical protein